MSRRRLGITAAAAVPVALVAALGWNAVDVVSGHDAITSRSGLLAAAPAPPTPYPSYGPGMMNGRSTPGPGYGPGMMGGPGYGPGMMGTGQYGIPGTGPVTALQQARSAAQRFADRLGLRVGEVMRFSRNFYAELNTPAGKGGTEVLIDPGTGAVGIEYGPAMMWNTRYGPHAITGAPEPRVSADQARRIADQWLKGRRSGMTAGTPDAFPGYYTLHTMRGDKITGMLSVNAYTGAVWYHSWHGTFIAMIEK